MTREELELVESALVELDRLVADLMPGVRYIALQDYARLNNAPIAGDKALETVRRYLRIAP